LYPNGDRLDFCTSGDAHFKLLTSYLSKQGFVSKSHELIERLMPTYRGATTTTSTAPAACSSHDSSQTKAISNDMSMLAINQSRNLLNSANASFTFRELNLFPRVFLLLQEI
jgi:hypothetical protein